MTFSWIGFILRFLLGGSAVAASAVIGHRMGGRVGGIFAAFPAVFASAVIAAAVGLPEREAVGRIAAMSNGALVGMGANIACALAAGWLVGRWGWKKGLLAAVSGWVVLASAVYFAGAAMGWLR